MCPSPEQILQAAQVLKAIDRVRQQPKATATTNCWSPPKARTVMLTTRWDF